MEALSPVQTAPDPPRTVNSEPAKRDPRRQWLNSNRRHVTAGRVTDRHCRSTSIHDFRAF